MSSGRRLIFFGNERLVSGLTHTDAPILTSLIEAGYTICAVVVNDAGTSSRIKKVLEVAEIAKQHNISVLSPKKPLDIYDELASYNADAGILVAYGRIVPQKLIDLFPFGIINIHPSLLPKYRGPSPIESAIVNGDQTTGISIMSLSAAMDAGPVYHQIKVHLSGDETAPHLAATLTNLAAAELIATLPTIFDGALTPKQQNEQEVTYCQLIAKSDAWLQPTEQTAHQAERLVRAYTAFPKARITLLGYDVIILSAHVEQSSNSPLVVAFTTDYLVIDELVAPSGKRMTGDAFLKGYAK